MYIAKKVWNLKYTLQYNLRFSEKKWKKVKSMYIQSFFSVFKVSVYTSKPKNIVKERKKNI